MGFWNALGRYVPTGRKKEIPIGMKRPESLQSMIRRMVSTSVSEAAVANGGESIDEANDFEVADSVELEDNMSRYQTMAEEIEVNEDAREAIRRRKDAEIRRRIGANRDEERGRGGGRREENADRERQFDGGRDGMRRSYRERDQSREDEDAGERRRSRRVEEDR